MACLVRFPSEEWINVFMGQLNANKNYEEAAKTWEGDFLFVIGSDAELNDQSTFYVDLWHGKCRGVALLKPGEDRKAAFIYSGTILELEETDKQTDRPDSGPVDWEVQTHRDLLTFGERILMAKRVVNLRLGATVEDDQLPKHTLKPFPDSPAAGNVPDLSRQLREYYALRGWDPISGDPTHERLHTLGIESLSAYLPPKM